MNDLGHTHSFVVDPPLPRRHHREVVNRQRAYPVDRDRPVEQGPGYGHTVVSSDGGWSAADLRARWSRQTNALRLGIWLGARAAGNISAGSLTTAFPSAFNPSVLRTSDPMSPPQRIATEHAVDILDSTGLVPITTDNDVWAGAITTAGSAEVASVSVVFPRPGDPRGLHDPGLIERVGQAGAGVRIGRNPPTPANPLNPLNPPNPPNPPSVEVWTPIATHELLIRWALACDTRIDIDNDRAPSVAEADRLLRRSILEAEAAIDELGLRAGRSLARDLLDQASAELAEAAMPRSFASDHRSLLLRAAPIAWMCELALADDSVIVTRTDYQVRYAILTDLDRAARDALEAATSWSRST